MDQPLQLTLGASRCIYCGKDAETCEHNERDLDWSQYADKESDADEEAFLTADAMLAARENK